MTSEPQINFRRINYFTFLENAQNLTQNCQQGASVFSLRGKKNYESNRSFYDFLGNPLPKTLLLSKTKEYIVLLGQMVHLVTYWHYLKKQFLDI